MKILRLKNIDKNYFHLRDLAQGLNISLPSAKVAASRYVKAGLLLRLKRNLYVLSEKWPYLPKERKFQFAGLIQSPSYISLLTALSYYEISTQIQQDFIESVCLKRSKRVTVQGTVFQYIKIKKELFFSFVRKETFFIAEPEKALLDAFYLMSLQRYTLDVDAVDFERLDFQKLKQLAAQYPSNVQKTVAGYE